MNKQLVIGLDSYLLRKGIVHLAKELPGQWNVLEFDSPTSFLRQLSRIHDSLFILAPGFYDELVQYCDNDPSPLERAIVVHNEEQGADNALVSISAGASKSLLLAELKRLYLTFYAEENVESLLSPRENTILREVAMGLTNKQIADKLFLSTHTVMTHRKNISNKLGIKSVSGLTVYAIVNKLIAIEELSSNQSD